VAAPLVVQRLFWASVWNVNCSSEVLRINLWKTCLKEFQLNTILISKFVSRDTLVIL